MSLSGLCRLWATKRAIGPTLALSRLLPTIDGA